MAKSLIPVYEMAFLNMTIGRSWKVPGVSLIVRWAALVVALCLAFTTTAHAQRAAAAGGVISAIQIQGNVRSEPETIRSYLQLKVGQAYDPAAAVRSLKALFGTGR